MGVRSLLLLGLSDRTLKSLYKIAKNEQKGAYPFFRHPKAMIELRKEIERRGL